MSRGLRGQPRVCSFTPGRRPLGLHPVIWCFSRPPGHFSAASAACPTSKKECRRARRFFSEPHMKPLSLTALLVLLAACTVLVLALFGLSQPDEKTAMKTATIPSHKAPAYSKSGYDLGP